MNNRILLTSTGTMVSTKNNYDYKSALKIAAQLHEEGVTSGIELMMLQVYYGQYRDVAKAIKDSGLIPYTIHCEKEIGTLLSDAGAAAKENDLRKAENLKYTAFGLFELNCIIAELVEAKRMVLHLWGGRNSDNNIDYNISCLDKLNTMASRHGVEILLENIPSSCTSPLTNWKKVIDAGYGNNFIYDTRFGQLHEEHDDIFAESEVVKRITHVHISDFAGKYREFFRLRPILHPNEGSVDFEHIKTLLNNAGYDSTITLESPVDTDDGGWDVSKLRNTLTYLDTLFDIKNR